MKLKLLSVRKIPHLKYGELDNYELEVLETSGFLWFKNSRTVLHHGDSTVFHEYPSGKRSRYEFQLHEFLEGAKMRNEVIGEFKPNTALPRPPAPRTGSI